MERNSNCVAKRIERPSERLAGRADYHECHDQQDNASTKIPKILTFCVPSILHHQFNAINA